jgi:tetratricopeptide (TPR) repeat protein
MSMESMEFQNQVRQGLLQASLEAARNGNHARATEMFELANKPWPEVVKEHLPFWTNLRGMLLELPGRRRGEEALEVARYCAKLEPQSPDALRFLVLALLKLGRDGMELALAYRLLGDALRRAGKPAEASAAFVRAAETDTVPEGVGWLCVSRVQESLGSTAAAAETFEQAARLLGARKAESLSALLDVLGVVVPEEDLEAPQ